MDKAPEVQYMARCGVQRGNCGRADVRTSIGRSDHHALGRCYTCPDRSQEVLAVLVSLPVVLGPERLVTLWEGTAVRSLVLLPVVRRTHEQVSSVQTIRSQFDCSQQKGVVFRR
jgi:hypothetical protein